MRGLRVNLILLVITVSLGTYIFFVERHRAPASETPPNERLFSFEAEEISNLQITASDKSITQLQQNENGEWSIIEPVQAVAEDPTVAAVAESLTALEVQRVVEEGIDTKIPLAQFGLEEPSLDIGFSVNESTTRHLLVGDQTPTGSDLYAKLSDENRIFLISSHLNNTFDKNTFALRDKTVLNFERENLDKIEITSDDQFVQLTKNSNDGWQLQEPWNANADDAAVNDLITSLSTERFQAVVNENADNLDPYGLINPKMTVKLTAGSSTATLDFGEDSETAGQFTRDLSRNFIFTTASSFTNTLNKQAVEYRRKKLFGFSPFSVSRLEIEKVDETFVFEKSEEDSEEFAWLQIMPSELEIEQAEMTQLLSNLSALEASSFVENRLDSNLNDMNLVATVRVHYGDPEKKEVVLFWKSENEAFGIPEGQPGAARIDGKAFDETIDALSKENPAN
tara:strand:+ start:4968 stop:6326 length:1359 start_codon:yes stop_codon:yes gene_type:complete